MLVVTITLAYIYMYRDHNELWLCLITVVGRQLIGDGFLTYA